MHIEHIIASHFREHQLSNACALFAGKGFIPFRHAKILTPHGSPLLAVGARGRSGVFNKQKSTKVIPRVEVRHKPGGLFVWMRPTLF
jgi:hypothetical protein